MGSSAKSLGLGACTALVVGNMIGSGVFALPASLAPFGGIALGDPKSYRGAPHLRRTVVLAAVAFLYALGAIYGAGAEIVFHGFLLLLAGVPVFVWVRWRALVPAIETGNPMGGRP